MKDDGKQRKRHDAPRSAGLSRTGFLLATSAVLLCAAFYPPLWGLSVFVALVPALEAARTSPLRRLFLVGWAAGYLVNLFLFYWLAIVTVSGWLLLPIYIGLYLPVFLCAVEILARRFAVPRILAVVTLWPVLEYAKGGLLTGLPWFYLGHALYRWPRLIQSADVGGVLLVSAVVAVTNALLADAMPRGVGRRRRRISIAAAAAILVLNFGYGSWRVSTLPTKVAATVGLVQPNVPQSLKITQNARQSAEIFADLRSATLNDDLAKTDVVFWPETIMPGLVGADDFTVANGMNASEMLEEAHLQGKVSENQARVIADAVAGGGDFVTLLEEAAGARLEAIFSTSNLLAASARIAGRPLVAGAIAADVDEGGNVMRTYNRACHFDPAGRLVSFYDKVHLVPFGEFIPFRQSWPAFSRVIAGMMPVAPNTWPGEDFAVFEIDGVKYAPAICFEDTFSYIGRRCRRMGADVLVNLTNDGWFGDSFELEAHLGNAVFRTVETRMAVVRAANTGISAVISPSGSVTTVLSDRLGQVREVSGVLAAGVPVSPVVAPYVYVGDTWLLVALAAPVGYVAARLFRRRFE